MKLSDNKAQLSLADILRAQHIKRWTIVNTSKSQSLAEHTFNVIAITRELCRRLDIDDILPMKYAFDHDLDEILCGDVPTPAKHRLNINVPYNGKSKHQCDQIAVHVVKLADMIDAYTFISECGVGSHAEQVKEYVETKLYAEVNRLTSDKNVESREYWDSIGLYATINDLVKSIKSGRFTI